MERNREGGGGWEGKRKGGRVGGQETGSHTLNLSVFLQICSQSHLWCAQLQGSAGQVGQGPSLGGVGPSLVVSSSLPFSEVPLPLNLFPPAV